MYIMNKSAPALMIIMAMMAANGQVIAEQAADPASRGFQPVYPEWPERFLREEIVPPPPGGPYMSTALSGADAFPDYTGGIRNEPRERQMPSPFFQDDMPWPEVKDMPERWMPESGEYTFVPDEIVKRLEAAPARPSFRQGFEPGYGRPQMPPPRPYYGGYRGY